MDSRAASIETTRHMTRLVLALFKQLDPSAFGTWKENAADIASGAALAFNAQPSDVQKIDALLAKYAAVIERTQLPDKSYSIRTPAGNEVDVVTLFFADEFSGLATKEGWTIQDLTKIVGAAWVASSTRLLKNVLHDSTVMGTARAAGRADAPSLDSMYDGESQTFQAEIKFPSGGLNKRWHKAFIAAVSGDGRIESARASDGLPALYDEWWSHAIVRLKYQEKVVPEYDDQGLPLTDPQGNPINRVEYGYASMSVEGFVSTFFRSLVGYMSRLDKGLNIPYEEPLFAGFGRKTELPRDNLKLPHHEGL